MRVVYVVVVVAGPIEMPEFNNISILWHCVVVQHTSSSRSERGGVSQSQTKIVQSFGVTVNNNKTLFLSQSQHISSQLVDMCAPGMRRGKVALLSVFLSLRVEYLVWNVNLIFCEYANSTLARVPRV